MKSILFAVVLAIVGADGLVLLLKPTLHAHVVNRWNAALHIPSRVRVESYQGLRWRVGGLGLVVTVLYVFLAWLRLI